MGLDLWHVRPSTKDEGDTEYFSLEELKGYPGFIERHKHLMVEIVNVDSLFTIYVFRQREYREEYASRFGDEENNAFLVGEIDNLSEELAPISK